MNWTQFQTHGMAPDKAFEMLCNQLFENWCREEYPNSIASISVVNGAGGDGGVESYAVLLNGDIVALQAKWFPDSMTSSQIGQIRNSVKTAMKVRPAITRYLVCVPRDLASVTARSENAEDTRWDTFIAEIAKDFPSLTIELWNETRLVEELQKPLSSGIYRFWFGNAEISESSVKYAFEKAKSSWLNTKYVPELNTYGKIEQTISLFLGNTEQRRVLVQDFAKICELCQKFQEAAEALLVICTERDAELKEILRDTSGKLHTVHDSSDKIRKWLEHESVQNVPIDISAFNIDFESLIDRIHRSQGTFRHHFHSSEVTKHLQKLSEFDFYRLIQDVEAGFGKRSFLFLGDPGTGKTQGFGAVSEKLLREGLHIPLLIQARGIPSNYAWKDIISGYLGLSSVWSEEDIWQALTSMVNRHKFTPDYVNSDVKVSPKVIIFVDGLDESAPQARWVDRIRETDAIVSRYTQIRFCFAARPTAMPKPFDYANIRRLSSGGDVPAYKLFDGYMQAYNITVHNRGWLKSALTTPLALKLFCELNQNSSFNCSDKAEVSMATLWRLKIERIEKEYCETSKDSPQNQHILKAIVHLSEVFMSNATLERSSLVNSISNGLSITVDRAEKVLLSLENYGVLSSYRECGTGILPDVYNYYPGIQGYFDFATASILLLKHKNPQDIDFSKYPSLHSDVLNGLAILSIQNYDFLITRNKTLASVIDEWSLEELQFLALQHTNHTNAQQFIKRSQDIMAESADGLITIANRLVLPLARDLEHPLGVMLLDNFLNSFDKPAQRDILWSIPGYLKDGTGKRWFQNETFALQEDEYSLTEDDVCDGCPTIHAWALSSVNNTLRKLYRDRLMTWARLNPDQFYKLFLKFANVNDPQIRSDLFSILMCLVYDGAQSELVEKASKWLLANILHPDRIDSNRDVSIRYYSVAIMHKAVRLGVISDKDALSYMPPYSAKGNSISLNKDALKGTRMGGFKAIDYDLARYVLIDHFHSAFVHYRNGTDGQFDRLVQKIALEQREYSGISIDQFILSAAYAYILEMGWTEEEFYNFSDDEAGQGIVGGVDISITRTYTPSTHGAMSPVMTVCEKYVWQARNVISGFLCDRLLYGSEATEITDYGMLDDFVIPTQEISQINPDNIPEDRPWHIPEPEIAILEGKCECRDDVIKNATDAPQINWKKWITVDNTGKKYKVDNNSLIALDMASCFYGSAGVETNLFITALLVDTTDVPAFISALEEEGRQSDSIANPTDWYGGTNASCYITPKEICCFPWKTRYESYHVDSFPQVKIHSAVDNCCYNSPEYGDVYYYLPSTPIRDMMGIVDSDGYLFTNNTKNVVAEYTVAGEKWRTYQSYLLVDRDILLERLQQQGQALVWIMRERRSHSGLAVERFGRFGVDRIKSYVGFFEDDSFVTKEIRSEILSNIPISSSIGD